MKTRVIAFVVSAVLALTMAFMVASPAWAKKGGGGKPGGGDGGGGDGGGGSVDCSTSESWDPTIAYLTDFRSVDGVNSADIMVSNEDGCKLTLLVEGAFQYLTPTNQDDGVNRFIQSVWKLTYSARGDRGFVAWVDHYKTPDVVMGLGFSFDSNGDITLDTELPQELYVPDGRTADAIDVYLNWNDEWQRFEPLLAMVEYSEADSDDRLLSLFNATTGDYTVISTGPCNIPSSSGGCWVPHWWEVRWSPNGDAIYFATEDLTTANYYDGVARSRQTADGWQDPELIVVLDAGHENAFLHTVSSSGLLVYGAEEPVYHHKNGRLLGMGIVDRVIDLNVDACGSGLPCRTSEGVQLQKGQYGYNRRLIWTRDHTLIFPAVGSSNSIIQEIVDPLTGELGSLGIKNVQREVDTSE